MSDKEENEENESQSSEIVQPKKRKLSSGNDKNDDKPSKKRVLGIDDEAEQSDEDDNNEGDEDDDEEDKNDYVADDFLIMEDDTQEEIARKHKQKTEKIELKRLKKRREELRLDEDDEMLVREAMEKELKELGGGSAPPSDGEDDEEKNDDEIEAVAVEELDNTAQGGKEKRGNFIFDEDEEGSDMGGFIVHDEMEQDSQQGDQEWVNKEKAPVKAPVRRPGRREGPTYDQIQEAIDIFGAGYEDLDDEVDEPEDEFTGLHEDLDPEERAALIESTKDKKLVNSLRARYERSQLVASFCTDKDDELRAIDRPERYQELMKDRETPDADERLREAEWMAAKLAKRILEDSGDRNGFSDLGEDVLRGEFTESINMILKFIQVDQLDIPFIRTYRSDYLHPKMEKTHLWWILQWDELWEVMYASKSRLLLEMQALTDAAASDLPDAEVERQALEFRLNEIQDRHQSLVEEVEQAEAFQKEALDFVDENEEATAEDRDRVLKASQALEEVQLTLEETKKELFTIQQEYAQQEERMQRMAKYDPQAAREVLSLFPHEKYATTTNEVSEEIEIRDISQCLRVLSKRAERVINTDVDNTQLTQDEENEEGDDLQTSKKPKTLSQKPKTLVRNKDDYSRYQGLPGIRDLAALIAAPAHEVGPAVLGIGPKVEPPVTPQTTPQEAAAMYVEGPLKSVDQVLKATVTVLATELSLEPHLRRAARMVFRNSATISTRPTEKGVGVITPFSEYFGIHLLKKKRMEDFYHGKQRTLFIRLVEAKRLGLIEVTLDPPTRETPSGEQMNDALFLFEQMSLFHNFMPSTPADQDERPEVRPEWDGLRLKVLMECLQGYLIPSFQKEFWRDLLRVGREAIIEESAAAFQERLKIGPYRPVNEHNPEEATKDLLRSCPRRPFYATVVAVWTSGSSNRDPICMAYVSAEGVLRAHDLLPSQAFSQKGERLKAFITSNKPDLVVLNGSGGGATRAMMIMLQKNIIPEVGAEVERLRQLRRETSMRYDDDDDDDEQDQAPYAPQVMILKDDVANIFKNSIRAKKLFPEMQPGEAAAVSLARFAQAPLAEYCHLWTAPSSTEVFGFEALYLDLHPLKDLLRGLKLPLLRALESELIDAVCDVGVDINKAASYDHYAPLLAFISGMGLRKADALRQNIRRMLGVVDSRNVLLTKKLLGINVWNNASGFLRICDLGQERQLDPLDNTRIHPECYITYDFAPKICADALEVANQPNNYLEIVEDLMRSVKKELEKRLKKHPLWVALWEKGRPIPGVTPYSETVRTVDGVEHPLSIELSDSLSELMLDEYARDLEESNEFGRLKRKKQLETIKEELRYPWLDLRKPLTGLSNEEMFSVITGESDYSLYPGLKIGCTVTALQDSNFLDANQQLKRKQFAKVNTDSGLRASIQLFDVSDDRLDRNSSSIADYLQPGQRLLAVVVGVNKDQMHVDLSVKPSHLQSSEAWWMRNRFVDSRIRRWFTGARRDPDALFLPEFDEEEALRRFEECEEEQLKTSNAIDQQLQAVSLQSRSTGGGGGGGGKSVGHRRVVQHPLFVNLDYRATEERMKNEHKGAGEVLIRPSSKGADYLTITWAFQEDWFKHIPVMEKGKRAGDMGLGSELFVEEEDMKEPFSDLDEIFARYIEPMNDLVAVMVRHRSFMPGSPEEVEKAMREQLRDRPERIPYFFRFDPARPGAFVLTWMSTNVNSADPVKQLKVEVRPYGYRVRSNTFARPSDLIVWFKKSTIASAIPKPPVPPKTGRPRNTRFDQQSARPAAAVGGRMY